MVRQYDAQQMCDEYLRTHGLYDKGWRTNFTKANNVLAKCSYTDKRIIFSCNFLEASSEIEVRETILHETAHALTPGAGHDFAWIEKALELGLSNPKPCGEVSRDNMLSIHPTEVKEPKKLKSISATCPKCGATAVEVSHCQLPSGRWSKLECGHLVKADQLATRDILQWQNVKGTKTIFPYQAEGFRFLEQANGRALIADEPALGKTLQAMAFLNFHRDVALPCLWICKSSLKVQAIKEALEWCGPEFMGQTIDTARSFILPGFKLYVISMDLLRRIDDEKLAQIGIKTIVADEIQHFKNPESSRTRELRKLVAQVDFFLPLSGTPWKNRGLEFFPILNMLRPDRFPSIKHFENNWVDYYIDPKTGKYKAGGIRNIAKFKEFTKDFVIRRLRSEVQKDLPAINRQVRFVDMEKIYGDSYDKAEAKVAEVIKDAVLEGRSENIAGELMRLKHITGLAKVDVCAEDIIEFLEYSEDTEKFSIGIHHIDVGDLLEQKLNPWLIENGYLPCLRLKGGENDLKRDKVQQEFKDNIKARVFIISTLAGGEGLNLQFCDNAGQLERQWNPANEEQFELRFSRPITISDLPEYLQAKFKDKEGKKVSIKFPYYIAAGTVDEMLTEIVERKRANFLKVMNSHVCSKCQSRDIKHIDDSAIVCNNCHHEERFTWDESSIVKELGAMIIAKKYGKKIAEVLV